jgi:transposase-like protein
MALLTFKQYIEEAKKGTLHVVDIDDTLFHTTARVRVKNAKGKIIKYLSNAEFNNHKLKPGQSYDYKEFKNAKKFHDESKPIHPMINKVNKIQKNVSKHPNSRVIINTARADFDDKDKFLDTFRKQGVDIDKIHVHRVGNMTGPDNAASKKVKVVKQYIDQHSHKKVIMYDDSKTNLEALLNMKKEYPDVKFIAFHVKPNGTMKKYNGEK